MARRLTQLYELVGTRDLIEPILTESEEHVDWLETQLNLIDTIGLQNYLTEQMGEDEEDG